MDGGCRCMEHPAFPLSLHGPLQSSASAQNAPNTAARTFSLGPSPQANIADLLLPKGLPAGIQRGLIAPGGTHTGSCCQVGQSQLVKDLSQGGVRQRRPAAAGPPLRSQRYQPRKRLLLGLIRGGISAQGRCAGC